MPVSRSPLRTRKRKDDDDDGEEEQRRSLPATDRFRLADHLIQSVKPLGRPPTSEEEKRQVFGDLIRLKAAGKTNAQCAELLQVSSRTIDNYRADPLYHEIETDLETDARQRGYTTIAELIPNALEVMYDLMTHEKSGFVRFKAAEAIMNYGGYNMPRESAEKSNREEANRFLMELDARRHGGQRPVQVNVQINQNSSSVPMEASALYTNEPPLAITGSSVPAQDEQEETNERIPDELLPYYQPIRPGGKLPEGFQ